MILKPFFLIAAASCYLLAILNLWIMFDRGTLVWLNVVMAVYLCLGGVVLSLTAWYEPTPDRREGDQ